MTFNGVLNQFNKNQGSKDHYSIIIVDMDFEVMDELINEEQKSSATSSYLVLKRLEKEFAWIQDVPTLCVVDARLKHHKKRGSADFETKLSSSAIQHPQGSRDPIPTPQEERGNPFDTSIGESPKTLSAQSSSTQFNPKSLDTALNDTLHMSITKPFKNSKLIGILHELLSSNKGPAPPSSRRQWLPSVGSISTLRRSSFQINGSMTPSSTSTASRRASSESSTSDNEQLTARLASIKTLVVDDNPVNVKVLSRMLTQIGIHSETANNGREALEVISKAASTSEKFQLVFMDIWMPEMNGLEASEKIRKEVSKKTTDPYIIALTACVMPGDREKCMEAGMNGYVSKPVRKEELEASIHTFTQICLSKEEQKDKLPLSRKSERDEEEETGNANTPASNIQIITP